MTQFLTAPPAGTARHRRPLGFLLCALLAASSGWGQRAEQVRAGQEEQIASAQTPADSAGGAGAAAPEDTNSQRRAMGRVAPYVPTPMIVVERMLQVAGVTASDTVYDLGSGDGRVVIMAAEKHGARAVGVELNLDLARESQETIESRGLGKLARIIQGDLFETDASPATVVFVYLLQSANRQLAPILEKDLKPGTRVIAHDIRFPDWKPVEEVEVFSEGAPHYLYVYKVPESFRR